MVAKRVAKGLRALIRTETSSSRPLVACEQPSRAAGPTSRKPFEALSQALRDQTPVAKVPLALVQPVCRRQGGRARHNRLGVQLRSRSRATRSN